MNETEFIIWLRGFVQACNPYQATPKQWEELREKLDETTDTDFNLIFFEKNCSKTW